MNYSNYVLGDIADTFRGLPIPRARVSVENEIPYLHYGDIYKKYNYYFELSKHINDVIKICADEKIKKYQYLNTGDVVINLTSENYKDLGKSVFIRNDNGKLVSGMETTIIKFNSDLFDPLFLKYYFDTQYFYNDIMQYVRGMKVFRVNPKDLLRAKLPDIHISEQREIAKYIKSLDDKIEINIKINKNLEEMAHAIYKSWFVDFEFPDEDGEPYKFSDGEMVESELGFIPKGWEVKVIGDIIETTLGGTPSRKKKEYWNGEINWINSGKINDFRIILPSEKITDLGLSKSSTKILPKKTTVLAITGATLGQTSLLEIDSCTNQSVIGLIENNKISYTFIFPMIQYEINNLISRQTGGAQQHINKNDVNSFKIILPNLKILNSHNKIIREVYEKIAENLFENKALSDIRDTLLPKLMSGEIIVPIEE